MRRDPRRRGGFATLIALAGVTLVLGGLAGGGFFATAIAVDGRNQETWDRLTADNTGEVAPVTDAELMALRNGLVTQLQAGTAYAALATTTLPSGESAAEVAAGAFLEATANAATDYAVGASDPTVMESTEGTEPTGGTPPPAPELPPASGPVTITVTFRNLHTADPNPIHMMRRGEDFVPGNRVEPGASRMVTYVLEPGESLELQAGRGGEVFDRTTCGAWPRTSFEVVWDDSLGLDPWMFSCL